MKILDTIILSMAVGLLLIGVHQAIYNPGHFADNYSLFMLMIGLLGWFQLRRIKRNEKKNG
jgi:Na+/proline symporter